MKIYFLTLVSFLTIQWSFSQNSKLWKGYFSYNEINDLSQSPDKFFAASENAIFSKDILSGSITTINTIDGLSGQTITSLYYSPTYKKTIVGYENGLLIVINEVDGSMVYVVDIINKSIPQNVKKVNHFMEYNGIVYVSCDFGIVQYNLDTLQFGDTYFIGDNGAQIIVKQTAVFQNRIYAATLNNGMRSASITNPNLNDFNQWTTLDSNSWTGVETFDTQLMAVSNSGNLYRWQGTAFGSPILLPQPAVDIRKSESYLVVTTQNQVLVYNSNLSQVTNINSAQIPDITPKFSCAILIGNTVFIGTTENGVISKKINESTFEDMTPNGPLRNNVFAISTTPTTLWAVYGGYDLDYNPYTFYGIGGPTKFGVSKFNSNGWLNIPYESITGARALSRITINPNNESQVFISSYYSGVLKLENDQLSAIYNTSNTGNDGLETIAGQVPDDIRVNGAAYDKSGNLWVTNAMVKKGLKVFKANGQWQSYDMESIYSNLNKFKMGRMVIDKNGTKWMGTWRDGVVGFNEAYGNRLKSLNDSSDGGNLPSLDARAVAIDNNNQLWIGTLNGLRVLSSVDSFLSDAPLKSNAIIIIEDNLAQELLYEQSISDIFVDGANNKWIGTADSGVFLVSADGQKTLYHFTTNNSPLPSNTINDIDVNSRTGEVFFATTKGMVSFKGTATSGNDNLNNAYVFPNPVRPEYTGTVKISGLMDKVHVKITDIEGNLVFEVISEGGTVEWDTTAFGKYKVASGVYMVFISSEDGAETKVKKIMIVR